MVRPGLILLGLTFLVVIGAVVAQKPGRDYQASKPLSAASANTQNDEDFLISLGINSNPEISESSGVAVSGSVKDAIWTHNDSGHKNRLYLIKTDGKLLANFDLQTSRNIDWEAMDRFKLEGKSYLIVGDVGDNDKRRKNYQLYLVAEPDLAADLDIAKRGQQPVSHSATPVRLDFTYEDGPRNCEAIAVDVLGKKIWLVEKIYVDTRKRKSPGIYVLPLTMQPPAKPLVAKRIADFPPRNVTGMGFSPDQKRLIIRNYVNAHLYSREKVESWEEAIKKTNPSTVVLPLQRQGEAVCFSDDSQSIILTSEMVRQPIWQVNLQQYFKVPRRLKKKKSGDEIPVVDGAKKE